jgi:hypothetical protein
MGIAKFGMTKKYNYALQVLLLPERPLLLHVVHPRNGFRLKW